MRACRCRDGVIGNVATTMYAAYAFALVRPPAGSCTLRGGAPVATHCEVMFAQSCQATEGAAASGYVAEVPMRKGRRAGGKCGAEAAGGAQEAR